MNQYLKTTIRYLLKNKMFTAINLAGLTIGMCVVFFAALFVKFELEYDSFHEKGDRIYRLVTDVETPTGITHENTSGAAAAALETDFPGVKAARIFLDYYIVRSGDRNFGEQSVAYADSSVFSVFTLPMISGKPSSAFTAANNAVLSETAALTYFGTTDCIGKILTLDSDVKVTVTGVIKDLPLNSHFKADFLLSMQTLIGPETDWNTNWNRFGFYTYLLLPENYSAERISSGLNPFTAKHVSGDHKNYKLAIEPLSKVYMEGLPRGNKAGSTATGNMASVYIFASIAVFVLFIACFNFINLTTAISMQRAKEVGLRKILGASRQQLIMQFLADAVLLCLVAFVLSLLVCELSLPLFNQLAGKVISTSVIIHGAYLLTLLLIAIGVGLMAGIYPALTLSGMKFVEAVKGSGSGLSSGLLLRKSLVVAQFSISVVLIISTIVVYRQLDFIQNKQLGFKKDQMLVIDFHYDAKIRDNYQSVTA